MKIDLNWDDVAYILALLDEHKYDPSGTRGVRIARELVCAMNDYDGDSNDRRSKDIKERVAHWRKKIFNED